MCFQWLQLALLVTFAFLIISRCRYPGVQLQNSVSSSTTKLSTDGVVFFANGVTGSSRLTAYELARRGFHILIAVRDQAERRSYSYSLRKGMELINFDISDPSTYPALVDRLRYIKRGLHRPLSGILINLTGVSGSLLVSIYSFVN